MDVHYLPHFVFMLLVYVSSSEGFQPRVVYKFKYAGEVVIGVPSLNKAETTRLGLTADCSLVTPNDNLYILQLDNIQFGHKFNKLSADGRQPRSSDDVTNDALLSNEQTSVLSRWLHKPIKFRYQSGDISDISTDKTDEYWSVNVKKGLLSLLQVNLNQRNMITAPTEHRHSSSAASRRVLQPTYSVSETDVTGECEVKYVINTVHNSSQSNAVSTMYVTKTRNFQNCDGAQSYVQGLPQFLAATKANVIDRLVTTDYVITGDRYHFLIQSVQHSAQYQLAPFGDQRGYISSDVKQSLVLDSTSELTESFWSQTEFTRDRRGLKMDIPSSDPLTASRQTTNDQQQQQQQQTQYRQLVDRKLTTLIESMYPTINDSSTRLVLELHHVIRHMTRHQLYDVITWYSATSNDRMVTKKRDVLLSLLPSLMSPEAVHVLSDLIVSGQLRGLRAVLITAQLSLVVKPTQEVARTLLNLSRELSVRGGDDGLVKQSVLLAVGTVTNRMASAVNLHSRKTNEQIVTPVYTISEELEKLLMEVAMTEADKLQVLDAISNVGSRSLIRVLQSVAENVSETSSLRVAAVLAMRKLAKTSRPMIHPVLLTLFTDRRAPDNVRSAAALLLINSQPLLSTLQLIARSIDTEPNRHIQTLVYTNIVRLARQQTSLADQQQVSNNARLVLRLMKPIAVQTNNSWSSLLSYVSDDHDIGLSLKADHIKSMLATEFPDVMHSFSLLAEVFGDHVQLAQLAFGGQLNNLLDKMADWPLGGLLRDVITGQHEWSTLSQFVGNAELGADVWNKFRALFSTDSTADSTVLADGFWRLMIMDHVVMSAAGSLKQADINKFTQTLSGRLQQLISQLSTGYDVDELHVASLGSNSLIIPTTLGITLTVNISAVSTAKVDGRVKINNLPSVAQLMSATREIKDVHLTAQLLPSVSLLFISNVGVDMRWLATGCAFKTAINVDIPVDFDVTVNPRNLSGINIKYNLPKQDVRVAKMTAMPFNFIHLYPTAPDSRQPFQTRFSPITDQRVPNGINFQKRWKSDKLGVEMLLNVSKGYDSSIVMRRTTATVNDIFLQVRKSEIADVTRTTEKYDRTQSTYKQQSTAAGRRQPLNPAVRSTWNFAAVPLDSSISQPAPVSRTRYLVDAGVTSLTLVTSQLTLFSGASGRQLNVQAMRLDDVQERKQVTVNAVWTPMTSPQTPAGVDRTLLLQFNVTLSSTGPDRQTLNVKLSRADAGGWTRELRTMDNTVFWWQRMWQHVDTFNADIHADIFDTTHNVTGAQLYVIDINTSPISVENKWLSSMRDKLRHLSDHSYLQKDTTAIINNNNNNSVTLLCRIEPVQNTMSWLVKTQHETNSLTNVSPTDISTLLFDGLLKN